jgi:glycosyltransferase involved in cell wall biosynthesis
MTGLGKSARYMLEGLKKEYTVISVGYNFTAQNIAAFDIDYEIQGLDLRNSTDPNMLGDQVRDYIIRYEPDVVMFFGDVRYFLYLPSIIKQISETLLAGYITVDCANLPLSWLPTISTFDYLMVTSKFAAKEIYRAFNRESSVIYLGYNPKIFNTENVTRAGGLEEKQLVALRADRNQSRKNWPSTFDIWNRWSSDKDVSLLFHTKLEAEDAGAPNLKDFMYNLPHLREKSVCSNRYIAREQDFAKLLKSGDVFFTTTMGEGFGLPILESAACGIPTIGINFSASGELISDGAGIAIDPASYFSNSEGVKMALPNEYGFLEALDKVYADKKMLKELSERALEWAKPYTWDSTCKAIISELGESVSSSLIRMSVLGGDGKMAELKIERII